MDKIEKGDSLSQSENIVETNIDTLKSLFPEVVTEGKIDFKVLQDLLGEELEEGEEYYRFTWAGKANARREAQKPSTGTLRPAKDESVDWETTQNLYIEGDNLEVLKLLQKSYAGKVKMIYIDPPYNTGKDFVYKDNYKDNLRNYQEVTGQIDEEGNKLSTNSDSDGRYHSNWLNMMYPRLRLARNLLKDDGVIFISIDDNEVENLSKISNEVFGEENFLTRFIWRRRKTQANLAKHIAPVHDYILVYSKNSNKLKLNRIPFSDEFIKKSFSNPDNDKRGLYQTGPLARPANSNNKEYELELPNGRKVKAKWSCSQQTFDEYVKDNRLVIPRNGEGMPRKKIFLSELEGLLPNTWLDNIASNDDAAKETADIFGTNAYFSYPKPTKLMEFLLNFGSSAGDIVLDFFSGSASLGHAVYNLADKKEPRKYILVQLPEKIETANPAFKDGFETISRLAIERLKRVSKKIGNKEADLGYKVFKLDTSNIKGWDGKPANLDESLFDAQDNIKTDRTEHDVLYEILLKYGLDLTLPIEEKVIENKTVFSVGYGALFICLADTITSKVAEGIGAWKEELKPEVCRVVFKDSGFTDVEKTNSVQTLKRFGITEIKSI
ncbi:site-specific DNA-methyltransferase [Flavivirga aquimarina]|uniref:site-specific DNA-methyltransferase (adenine-specific) n=1 Tax=Flavivirga aquimarina TaxID=2027862 RepID=A0ABT8WAN7_9FLAO|nr:site-specific DNA-methyltransferase [Flavivirga aquimarina]MDO5970170.1 site-specific DNA-methyltransferase [Flavivirga aquimarina]